MQPNISRDTLLIERAIIGCLWSHGDPKSLGILTINPDYFLNNISRDVFKKTLELVSDGVKIDLITATKHLSQSEIIFVNDCIGIDSNYGHFNNYVIELKDSYYDMCIHKECIKLDSEIDVACSNRIKDLFDLKADLVRIELAENCKDLTHKYVDELGKGKQLDPDMSTGFPTIDKITWGLHRGELYTVGARPRIGKTSFLTTLAINLSKDGKRCIYFTTEMSKMQFMHRIVSTISGINSFALRSRDITTEQFNTVVQRVAPLIHQLPLSIDDSSSPTLSYITKCVKHYKPDVIFVDYLQRLGIEGKEENRNMEVTRLMVGLKNISRDYNLALVLAAQLSREAERRMAGPPTLSDLRESGSIENESDVVILLYRPDLKDKTRVDAVIEKNRHGYESIINMRFMPEVVSFREI